MSKERTEQREANRPVTEQASDWWVTLNANEATQMDHDAFRKWAERSPERIEAYLETALLTRILKSPKLRWPNTPVDELASQAHSATAEVVLLDNGSVLRLSTGPKTSIPLKVMPPLAIAASVLTMLAIAWALFVPFNQYHTVVGEMRSITLEDGSIVTLNTASRLNVRFDVHRRRIELASGEALFDVALDPNRPFEVGAGNTVVRALGTRFNVDLRPQRTVVTVVEGKVAVLSEESGGIHPRYESRASSEPNDGGRQLPSTEGIVLLTAGQQLTVDPRQQLRPRMPEKPADVAAVTAWTQRQLVFDHRSIGEVAEEFNRYNALQIEIAGPALRSELMTGVFKANDPESFLKFVSKMPNVEIERAANSAMVRASH